MATTMLDIKYGFLLIVFGLVSCSGPKAMFTIDTSAKSTPASITVKNLSKNGLSYLWDFGDGDISDQVNPQTKILTKSGLQTITLTTTKGSKSSTYKQSFYLDGPQECTVVMRTNLGDITMVLYNDTPKHQDNFIKLVNAKFYNDILFHRVINGFVAQVGDPNMRIKEENPATNINTNYTIPAEIIDTMYHVRGALAAARTPDEVNPSKVSSGTQFYIIDGRKQNRTQIDDYGYQKNIVYPPHIVKQYIDNGGSPQLDGQYTVFGKVISGMDVIDAMMQIKTDEKDRPIDDIIILEIVIVQ